MSAFAHLNATDQAHWQALRQRYPQLAEPIPPAHLSNGQVAAMPRRGQPRISAEWQALLDARLPLCKACPEYNGSNGALGVKCKLVGGSGCRCVSLITGKCPASPSRWPEPDKSLQRPTLTTAASTRMVTVAPAGFPATKAADPSDAPDGA